MDANQHESESEVNSNGIGRSLPLQILAKESLQIGGHAAEPRGLELAMCFFVD